ncbi:hypothetical protein GCM10010387_61700 [Streptomyces inusitatus]|uniref:Uncharacterized protein n=2 Tax=Streptomyces inusitatus TaxID=68221 RepID=A0A918V1W9_9ACTN|nr:hypothetical protein GCM10010387_61700 [Streptomyces inusitatus]
MAAAILVNMDEQLMRGRVYGSDHDDPDPGPRPGRDYAELVGGPLDGLLLDVTGWTAHRLAEETALPTEIGRYGPGGRSVYAPRPSAPGKRDWRHDTP